MAGGMETFVKKALGALVALLVGLGLALSTPTAQAATNVAATATPASASILPLGGGSAALTAASQTATNQGSLTAATPTETYLKVTNSAGTVLSSGDTLAGTTNKFFTVPRVPCGTTASYTVTSVNGFLEQVPGSTPVTFKYVAEACDTTPPVVEVTLDEDDLTATSPETGKVKVANGSEWTVRVTIGGESALIAPGKADSLPATGGKTVTVTITVAQTGYKSNTVTKRVKVMGEEPTKPPTAPPTTRPPSDGGNGDSNHNGSGSGGNHNDGKDDSASSKPSSTPTATAKSSVQPSVAATSSAVKAVPTKASKTGDDGLGGLLPLGGVGVAFVLGVLLRRRTWRTQA